MYVYVRTYFRIYVCTYIMYVCIYVCIYIYIYIYHYTYADDSRPPNVRVFINTHTYMYITPTHIHTCSVCVCVCVSLYTSVRRPPSTTECLANKLTMICVESLITSLKPDVHTISIQNVRPFLV